MLAPLLVGVITRTKSIVAGRRGPPLLQLYADVWKLLQKGAVYSTTTTWLFRAGPIVALASTMAAWLLVPVAGSAAPLAFQGDLIMLAALLAVGRFFMMTAAMDTGSAFEGMGASREALFSSLSEPAFYVALIALALVAGDLSLSSLLSLNGARSGAALPVVLLVGAALFLVSLAENSRIPVDDPNTHLELTMVHEVMVLDHSGPDLAFIMSGAALKLMLFAALLVSIILPFRTGSWVADGATFFLAIGVVGMAIGLVESTMARLRLPRVPELLLTATVLGGIGGALALGTV